MNGRFTVDQLSPKHQAEVAAQLYDHRTPRKVSHAKSQPDEAPTLEPAVSREAKGVSRATVRFTGYRVKPLDPDNFAGSCKDLLDGLRHANLISGDEAWRIRFETEQVKVAHFVDEKTVVEVIYPD